MGLTVTAAGTVRPGNIAGIVGDMPLDVSNSFRMLARSDLAKLVDKRRKLWQIIASGREVAANIQLPPQPSTVTSIVTSTERPVVSPTVTPPALV